jgi:ribosomal protein L29
MARALLGYVGTASQHIQELELARLRARVRELEAELGELRAEAAARRAVEHVDVDRELTRIVGESAALA